MDGAELGRHDVLAFRAVQRQAVAERQRDGVLEERFLAERVLKEHKDRFHPPAGRLTADEVPAALMLATELELAGRIDEAVGVLTKALSAVPSMHDVRRRIQRLLQESNRPRHAPGALKPFQAKHLAFVGPKGSSAPAPVRPPGRGRGDASLRTGGNENHRPAAARSTPPTPAPSSRRSSTVMSTSTAATTLTQPPPPPPPPPLKVERRGHRAVAAAAAHTPYHVARHHHHPAGDRRPSSSSRSGNAAVVDRGSRRVLPQGGEAAARAARVVEIPPPRGLEVGLSFGSQTDPANVALANRRANLAQQQARKDERVLTQRVEKEEDQKAFRGPRNVLVGFGQRLDMPKAQGRRTGL